MKASLAITVLNEEKTIRSLLSSILAQSVLPNEVVIVDGGSVDGTVKMIKQLQSGDPYLKKTLRLLVKLGVNRPKGRNISLGVASNEIIAITDAGCELHKDWFKNIIKPFKKPSVEVVSGFYSSKSTSIFGKCLAPYVLVMPDRVNPSGFLAATRSMAIRKSVWKKVGRFPEEFSRNEDYVFAMRLKKKGKEFHFVKEAIVYWFPRENLYKAFLMFSSFAQGDMEARIIRPKVVFLFSRYIAGIILLIGFFLTKAFTILTFICLVFGFYIIWSIIKNYKYVKDWRAIFILPAIQFTADIAVIIGSVRGLFRD